MNLSGEIVADKAYFRMIEDSNFISDPLGVRKVEELLDHCLKNHGAGISLSKPVEVHFKGGYCCFFKGKNLEKTDILEYIYEKTKLRPCF